MASWWKCDGHDQPKRLAWPTALLVAGGATFEVTLARDKRFLGFAETDTENERVLTPYLRSLKEGGSSTPPAVCSWSSTGARG